MSNMIYFTSDTHFGHENIIKYCKRPFASAAEMDAELIRRWNKVVPVGARVFHLGDVAWVKGRTIEDKGAVVRKIFKRLNGNISLILGNHDDERVLRAANCFDSIYPMTSVSFENQHITLCHFAMRVWNKSHQGSWQLYGHTHDVLEDWHLSTDVGVDSWDFAPVSFNCLKEHFKGREAFCCFDKLKENWDDTN